MANTLKNMVNELIRIAGLSGIISNPVAPQTITVSVSGSNFTAAGNSGVIAGPSTDENTVVQSALTALVSTGGKLFLKRANYSITTMLQGLGDNIEVEMESGGLFTVTGNITALKWGDGTYNTGPGTPYEHVTLKNIEVDLSGNSGNDVYGIWVHTVADVKIEGCHVYNQATSGVRAAGIALDECVGGTVENNHVHDTINGIIPRHGCRSLTVVDNHVHDTNNFDGIALFATDGDITINGNNVHDCADNGILLDGNSDGRNPSSIIVGNTSYSNTNEGIDMSASYRCTAVGNTTHTNGRRGIAVTNVGDEGFVVVGNTSYNNTTDGIWISASRFGTVTGNISRQNTVNGITFVSSCTNTECIGNQVYLNGEDGIEINGSAFMTIVGNNLRDNSQTTTNTYDEITLVGSSNNNVVQGNVIRINATAKARYGIAEQAAGDNNNLITDNLIVGAVTANGLISGAASIWRNNKGFLTENKGTGSILNTATAAVITHGLAYTPVASEINITFTENPSNTAGTIWVDTITSTQFTVNCENDPGASNLDFGWSVRRI